MVTRLFSRLFNAVQNDEDSLVKQVQEDLNGAKEKGTVDTDQLKYEKQPDGTINVVDKAANQTTKVSELPEGFQIESEEQKFLLPRIDKKLDELEKQVKQLNEEGSKDDGEPKHPDKAGEKEESAVQRGVRVVVKIDGQLVTAIVADNPEQEHVKVRVPSLQNQIITVPTDSIQIPTAAEADNIAQRQQAHYTSFSRKRTFSSEGDWRGAKKQFWVVAINGLIPETRSMYEPFIRKASFGDGKLPLRKGMNIKLGEDAFPWFEKKYEEPAKFIHVLAGPFNTSEEAGKKAAQLKESIMSRDSHTFSRKKKKFGFSVGSSTDIFQGFVLSKDKKFSKDANPEWKVFLIDEKTHKPGVVKHSAKSYEDCVKFVNSDQTLKKLLAGGILDIATADYYNSHKN